jgi:hypothetical protein
LVVEESSLPKALQVTARTTDGIVMALEHHSLPVVGLQFHPESILTESGYALLANFLRLAGLNPAPHVPAFAEERPQSPSYALPAGSRPPTF